MSDESTRLAKPGDMEQLAKLIDGRGNLQDRLDEAFTRASTLNVGDRLGPIKPMRSWVTKTAPDLRKRAAILRAGDGDPRAAALYAGFTPEQLKGVELPPDIMLIANASVANSDEFDAGWLKKRGDETISDWLSRIKTDAVAKVSGNKNLGEVVGDYIELTAFASTAPQAFKMSITGFLKLRKHFKHGEFLKAPGTTLAQLLRGQRPSSFIPTSVVRMGARIGSGIPAPILDGLAGKNELAFLSGNRWAWEANLLKVGKGASALKTAAGGGRFASVASGLGAAGRTAGWWRATGIVGGVVATGVGAFDLAQKNPAEEWKKDKAGYISDVSGVAFNASLTAAMVAPNPITIGAAAVTGAVYGVSSVIDNWDTVKQFPGKAADAGRWAGKKLGEGAGKLVDGGKKLLSDLNPF